MSVPASSDSLFTKFGGRGKDHSRTGTVVEKRRRPATRHACMWRSVPRRPPARRRRVCSGSASICIRWVRPRVARLPARERSVSHERGVRKRHRCGRGYVLRRRRGSCRLAGAAAAGEEHDGQERRQGRGVAMGHRVVSASGSTRLRYLEGPRSGEPAHGSGVILATMPIRAAPICCRGVRRRALRRVAGFCVPVVLAVGCSSSRPSAGPTSRPSAPPATDDHSCRTSEVDFECRGRHADELRVDAGSSVHARR